MKEIRVQVSDKIYEKICQSAENSGDTISGHVRKLFENSLDNSKCSPRTSEEHEQIFMAIRNLVPAFVESIGRAQEAPEKETADMVDLTLKYYDERNAKK